MTMAIETASVCQVVPNACAISAKRRYVINAIRILPMERNENPAFLLLTDPIHFSTLFKKIPFRHTFERVMPGWRRKLFSCSKKTVRPPKTRVYYKH
jgi:hypothetical protein